MRPTIRSHSLLSLTIVLPIALLTFGQIQTSMSWPRDKQSKQEVMNHPFLAVWQDDSGGAIGGKGPFLRFAIWSDGRVLFSKDPKKWGNELKASKLSSSRVARLKAALADTGVFDLKGTCYMSLHGPLNCLIVDLGQKKQMLSWDENEDPETGINFNPKFHHLEFKRCWKAVNHLGLVALPDDGEKVKEQFDPKSWHLKPAVQSE